MMESPRSPQHQEVQDQVDQDVAEFIEHRAVIEQAKGVLMQLLSVGEEQAFAILSRYSQDHNLRIREIAARIVAAAAGGGTPRRADGDVLAWLQQLMQDGPDPG